MEGITAKGKPLKDHLDIRGHDKAVKFLLDIVNDSRPLSEADIRSLHEMILVEPYDSPAQTADGQLTTKRIALGIYKTSANHVQTATGEIHYYASAEETPAKMQELMEWFKEASSDKSIHPVVTAALFHHKFVAIHPFDDGNGRLSRILMNLILMQSNYPPVVIKMDDRKNYYALLSRADNGDNWPFIEYIIERLKSSLQLFVKGVDGEDIDEEEDVDKEIALFKTELKNKAKIKEKISKQNVSKVIEKEILPLFEKIFSKASSYKEFFFSNYFYLAFHYAVGKEIDWEYKILPSVDDTYLNDKTKYFNKVGFELSLTEFKDDKNNFSIKFNYTVYFNDFSYTINNNKDNEILKKYYHEIITVSEQQLIIKSFMNELKSHIEKRF